MAKLNEYQEWFKDNREDIFESYFTFLKFKSVGTDPKYRDETIACAEWLIERLTWMGMQVETIDTKTFPVIVASSISDESQPILMLYGHYDVQPVDPIELWTSDPFDPQVRDGQVYARGAQDNKGQCFHMLEAVRAYLALSKGANVKIIIEGEEENGSVGLHEVAEKSADKLKCDYLVVNDVAIPAPGVPGVTLGARGISTLEVTCKGANTDLHSGDHGGMVLNPLRALVDTLNKMWDEDGRIAIDGIYDDVKDLTKEEREGFDLDYNESEYKATFGIGAVKPEPGYSPRESNWFRPSLEINGLWGGYTDEGFKTVIPAKAYAKISCRLVPNQDAKKVYEQISSFLQANMAPGIEIETHFHGGGPAFLAGKDSKIVKIALDAYSEVFGTPCKKISAGGSIPIIGELARVTGAEIVGTGTGLMDDNIHAPNEHYGLDRFEQGFLVITQMIEKVGNGQ
ncbi:MAG: dipeptidase [Simkaniaceae bacterium]|nr:dipeptidase [Simkaniaceae bacterium]